MKKIYFAEAVATLIGTIIGAGVLSLPFAIAAVGLIPGLILLCVLGSVVLITNLMVAEIILRTRARHQLAGYAKKYLGSRFYKLQTFNLVIGGFGALLAYIIGEGAILSSLLGGDKFVYSLIFFAAAAIVLFFGLNAVKVFELWLVVGFVIVIMVIWGASGGAIDISNYNYIDLSQWFIPYGVILFAMSGAASVVTMREILKQEERQLKKAVVLGTIIPIIIYIIFACIVIGVTGRNTTEVATVGLGNVIGPYMIIFGNLFAFFAIGTSFLTIGLIIRDFFHLDLKLSKFSSWIITMSVPLILFLAGIRDFIETIGIVGGFTVGFTSIIIIFTFWQAKKKGDRAPEFSLPKFKIAGWFFIMIFFLGMAYVVYDLIH
ncbi:hypothetical protein KKC32_00825 [Patescibacteria group bacterium]|nr:hypothetical protein [Patescibacteria group bacterium]